MRKKGVSVDSNILRSKAQTINQIVRQKKTRLVTKLRNDYQEDVYKYFHQIDELRKLHGDNYDETPIYMDMARDPSLHHKGEKEVKVLCHVASQHRLTASLSITSLKEVLTMQIIMRYLSKKNKKGDIIRTCPKKFDSLKNGVVPVMMRFNVTGFNNEQLFLEWIKKVLAAFMMPNQLRMNANNYC